MKVIPLPDPAWMNDLVTVRLVLDIPLIPEAVPTTRMRFKVTLVALVSDKALPDAGWSEMSEMDTAPPPTIPRMTLARPVNTGPGVTMA